MPLTPTDVHDKQFKLVRQSTGYDMDEVDSFLDEVEFEIGRLITELTHSQGALEQLQSTVSQRDAELAQVKAELEAAIATAQQLAEGEHVPAVAPAPTVVLSVPPVATAPESNLVAAARLLELAQRTADEHVAEAKREAEQILAEAQSRAAEAFAGLDERQAQAEDRVAALRQFAEDLRARMRGYLEGQLHELQALDERAGQSL